MNRKFDIVANKTYATEDNADKAVAKAGFSDLRHFMMTDEDGRFFPVFVGQEAMQRGAHFQFNVVG
ncbi:hypothetical protein UFOVP245_182 [uncultured Caudovirales phage]|uniref:Uncharacterized protein n=1 Tax=uncultured Caudovirales phage TaxID=2100421 RepID=A0A6J7WZR0_9CAUD|nr:hypothetical protein UFOVP245_182 [uncultured Caudovirales phage]